MLRVFAFSSLMLMASCAATDTSTTTTAEIASASATDKTVAIEPKSKCVRNASISGFQIIDEQHLLVTAPTKSRTYLITTKSRCNELDFSNSILIDSFSSCVKKHDKIIVADAMMDSRCYVESVEWVADKDSAMSLITARGAKDAPVSATETETASD